MSPEIEKRVSLRLADFLSSGRWKEAGVEKEAASEISRLFLECCYGDLGLPPEKLDSEELELLLFRLLPSRLGSEQEGAAQAPRIAVAFLRWDGEQRFNPNGWKLVPVCERAEREFPRLLRELGGSAAAAPTKPIRRPGTKVGRNDPCPCGSGKKYKKCCERR